MMDEDAAVGWVRGGSMHGWGGPPLEEIDVEKLFPLPLPSRSGPVADAISALNWLAGNGEPKSVVPTFLQSQVCARVDRLVRDQPRPGDALGDRASFLELMRGRTAYDGGDGPGVNLVPFRSANLVSMPDSVLDAPSVSELSGQAEYYLGGGM